LADGLLRVGKEELVASIEELLLGLERAPETIAGLADAICKLAPSLRNSQRARVKKAAYAALRSGPLAKPMTSESQPLFLAVTRVLAACATPGDPVPHALVDAADRTSDKDHHLALLAICKEAHTEDAANAVLPFLDSPDDEVAALAEEIVSAFESEHARIERDGTSARVVPTYRAPSGETLIAEKGSLKDKGGKRYALDDGGRPVALDDTRYGGCKCCPRPRVLVREDEGLPTCPVTHEKHLIDGRDTLLESEHPLGGCSVCESLKPLLRTGDVVRCPLCHTPYRKKDGTWVPDVHKKLNEQELAEMRVGDERESPVLPAQEPELPKPPTTGDLGLIEPTIRDAMRANVFLIVKTDDGGWSGSGVIVAQDGKTVAILTNRHVVVDDEGPGDVKSIRALTVTGEEIPVTLLWAAEYGVDLAVVTGEVSDASAVCATPIGDGACLVGSKLFAIGNPMGLSWSYTSGTLSAFRENESKGGVPLRLVQTQVPIAGGSSGGGLYHEQGHLVGIMSFTRTQMFTGGSAHFAITVRTVRDVLEREEVTFAGRPLLAHGADDDASASVDDETSTIDEG
jgi:hypothetical protein